MEEHHVHLVAWGPRAVGLRPVPQLPEQQVRRIGPTQPAQLQLQWVVGLVRQENRAVQDSK